MKLSHDIGLKKNDIVSIVGAGGKTTLMFRLAQENKIHAKVLATTTTKIYMPTKETADIICIGENNIYKPGIAEKAGIYVFGLGVNAENKIIGLKEEHLDKVVPGFDYTIIEADGAKGKRIKGWDSYEPVIYKGTTKTIGVLDIQVLGMKASDENVHRIEEFCKLTRAEQGDYISIEHLLRLIINPLGLFKNAIGDKILFINKAESLQYQNNAKQLTNELAKNHPGFLNRIVIGSLHAYMGD